MATTPTIPADYVSQSLDTTREVDRRLFDLLHAMTAVQKAAHLDAAIHFVEEVAVAGIRARHPDASPESVRLRLFAQRLDRSTMIRVYGWDPDREGMQVESEPLRAVLRVARALEASGLEYAVGGSIASGFYGEARATFNVDVLVDLPAWRVGALISALGSGFDADPEALSRAAREATSHNVIDRETGIKIDFFVVGDRPLDASQMSRRRQVALGEGGQTAAFSSPEDVVLRKLDWFRASNRVLERQWRDVLGVLKVQRERLDLPYLLQTSRHLGLSELLERALAECGLTA